MINNRQQSGRRRGRGGQRQNGTGGNSSSGSGRGPESGNRIDNRARGNAAQLLEKYKTLARDAQQAGDRVLTEYYLQFADHYFRVLSETRARYEENNPSRARHEFGNEEQGFEGEEGNEGQEDDDDDFAGSFRQPQRVPQAQPPQAQPQQNRSNEDRPREDRPRDNRPRDERPRDDRPREDRPRTSYQRDDRPRDSQPRDTQRDERPRDQAPQRDQQAQQPREQNSRDEQPRDNRPREPRIRRDYGDESRGNRAQTPAPQADLQLEASAEPATPAPVAPPRPARRPRAQPIASNRDGDDSEARLDIGVLPPAFSLPPSVSSEPAPVAADGEAPAEPKRRGRPRKVVAEAPAES